MGLSHNREGLSYAQSARSKIEAAFEHCSSLVCTIAQRYILTRLEIAYDKERSKWGSGV